MTVQKPEKCCFLINWKAVCYIFVYILMALQTITIQLCVSAVQYYYTRVNDVDISPDSDHLGGVITFVVFAGGFLICVAISLVVFNIIVLFGLYLDNWNYIKKYLIFGTMMLTLFIIVSIFKEVIVEKERSESVGNSIACVFNAYFLYVIRSYWLSLDRPKPDVESV
ncbi:PREDICTED: uncharacterized protein LOC106101623 [Papilio polytes]|uniref:uncharacterized protein LOC106101623 n=1 Tax=Papilio polytes TaxID=76194 RepID=UPI000676926B|nr:PREDICTED: uncharacterized protein LOC106101623 [Papilio polytes]XP_013136370.1 PREDICTED: uncharacterized protein LOC106101623 [Papilio polytes]